MTLVREAFEPTNETMLFLHLVKEQPMALVLRLVTHATSQIRDRAWVTLRSVSSVHVLAQGKPSTP